MTEGSGTSDLKSALRMQDYQSRLAEFDELLPKVVDR